MKISVPLATTVSTDFADMIDLLLGLGCRAHLTPCAPARRRDRGSKGKGGRGGGGSPGLHKRIPVVRAFGAVRAEGRGDRSGRSRSFPGLHPCPREGGALSGQKEGRMGAAPAETIRQPRNRLKEQPQESPN